MQALGYSASSGYRLQCKIHFLLNKTLFNLKVHSPDFLRGRSTDRLKGKKSALNTIFKNVHPEYTFASHYLDIGGHRLHYIDEGQGPVLVALHGNPTWSFFYRKVIARFRHHYRVIALDNMGCGFSDKPQEYEYTLERHISNLSSVLESLTIDSCSLMVHDWGGAIGMGYAVRNPEKIQKIVVCNTAAFRSRRLPLRIRICRLPVIGEILVRGVNGFAAPATFMAVNHPLAPETKKWYLLPYDSWRNRIAIHRFVQDIPLNEHHQSYSTLLEIEQGLETLANKGVPLLILWGGKDFCFTEDFYRQWKSRFPMAKAHLFPQLGHYLLEDGFEEIAPYLDAFLLPESQLENE